LGLQIRAIRTREQLATDKRKALAASLIAVIGGGSNDLTRGIEVEIRSPVKALKFSCSTYPKQKQRAIQERPSRYNIGLSTTVCPDENLRNPQNRPLLSSMSHIGR